MWLYWENGKIDLKQKRLLETHPKPTEKGGMFVVNTVGKMSSLKRNSEEKYLLLSRYLS